MKMETLKSQKTIGWAFKMMVLSFREYVHKDSAANTVHAVSLTKRTVYVLITGILIRFCAVSVRMDIQRVSIHQIVSNVTTKSIGGI